MKKIFIIIGLLIVLIVILLVVLIMKMIGGRSVNTGNLIYLEYKYNTVMEDIYDERDCMNINISKERGTVVFNYGDGSYKEYDVSLDDFIELDKILKKYDALNWDKYKDKEIIDGDNTFISFKYDNGEYGVISGNEYPKDKDLVFRDVELYLNKLKS